MHTFPFKIARAHLHNDIAPLMCHWPGRVWGKEMSLVRKASKGGQWHTAVQKWESPMGEWSFSSVELWDTLKKASPLREVMTTWGRVRFFKSNSQFALP